MKTKVILFVSLMIAVSTAVEARHDCDFERQAAVLKDLSNSIGSSHRDSLCGHRIDATHQRFLSIIHTLQGASLRLYCQAQRGEDPQCLASSLASVRRAFASVRAQAESMRRCHVRVSPVTMNYMCEFSELLNRMHVPLHASRSERDHRHFNEEREYHRESPRREPVSDRELVIGTIARLIGGR